MACPIWTRAVIGPIDTGTRICPRSMIDSVIISTSLLPYVPDTWVKRGAELSLQRNIKQEGFQMNIKGLTCYKNQEKKNFKKWQTCLKRMIIKFTLRFTDWFTIHQQLVASLINMSEISVWMAEEKASWDLKFEHLFMDKSAFWHGLNYQGRANPQNLNNLECTARHEIIELLS